MSHLRHWLIVLPLLCVGAGVAQQDPKKEKDPPKKDEKIEKAKHNPNEVEVRTSEGSTIRMIMLQESVDIVTKFGPLTVPMSEVRKIELGVHIDSEVAKKIETAIKNLNSTVFKERDEAVNELIKLGPSAYPSVVASSKSTDPEISQRAQMALKRIKAKFPADSLRLIVNDRIITNDFPIVGVIKTKTIKAENPILGALNLKLGELRSISWLGGNSEVEVVVEGNRYCNRTAWMDTNVNIEQGASLQITAGGEVDLLPGNNFFSGPQGNPDVGGRGGPGNRYTPGTLLGKVGESGTPFVIGERYSGAPAGEGKLFLNIVPGPWGGQPAGGNYKVKITIGTR
jgi:hypothetical protein